MYKGRDCVDLRDGQEVFLYDMVRDLSFRDLLFVIWGVDEWDGNGRRGGGLRRGRSSGSRLLNPGDKALSFLSTHDSLGRSDAGSR